MASRRARALCLSLAFASVGFCSAASAKVWVVDILNGAGTDFTSIDLAVAAAAEGDTILMRNWTSPTLDVDGKSLTIIGEPTTQAPHPILSSHLNRIRNLGPHQVVVLRGFYVYGLELSSNQGAVWIEGSQIYDFAPALTVQQCARVTIVRSILFGRNGGYDFFFGGYPPPGIGLDVSASTVHLADCTVVGGFGATAGTAPFTGAYHAAQNGAAACRLRANAQLIATGTSFTGGAGGGAQWINSSSICSPGADGGAGLWLESGAPTASLSGSSLIGGTGGTTVWCWDAAGNPFFAPTGLDGLPSQVDSGLLTTSSAPPRSLAANSPVREGQALVLSFDGIAGDSAFLLVAAAPNLTPFPAYSGSLLLAFPIASVVPVPLTPAGKMQAMVPIPELGAGIPTVRIFVQAAFCPTSGACVLGSGSAIVLFDILY